MSLIETAHSTAPLRAQRYFVLYRYTSEIAPAQSPEMTPCLLLVLAVIRPWETLVLENVIIDVAARSKFNDPIQFAHLSLPLKSSLSPHEHAWLTLLTRVSMQYRPDCNSYTISASGQFFKRFMVIQ
ncbi:hypothetical protein RRG08_063455 [Elysia crispata]|uniref:Uncharacterized protein n=1 Tax=Elysia crispata TaxID=231223 RepID=A0AAE1DUV3_9GAST|nr:hypothetical protein RRG08_063455 [Elysia crispata]